MSSNRQLHLGAFMRPVSIHTVSSLEPFTLLSALAQRATPELQRRGIFRRAYSGRTLREHLGLPRPANRFFPG